MKDLCGFFVAMKNICRLHTEPKIYCMKLIDNGRIYAVISIIDRFGSLDSKCQYI